MVGLTLDQLKILLTGHSIYWLFIILMMTGFYIVVSRGNLIKKIIGLNLFQTSVFLFYISIGKVSGGTAPILPMKLKVDDFSVYSNPLPHVLILTAIVVGVATTALGLALIIRIKEAYNSIEEHDLLEEDRSQFSNENNEDRKYGGFF
ncbi:MAG: Na+/H+ antiporter subunit C [Rhodobacteraceae bacterium]|nr:MAG: Na+/H+ antiporter subunit C [Paracoccaceae bacterium]